MKLLPISAAIMATLASPILLAADTQSDELTFSGYARFGAHYSDDEQKYVTADGQLLGNAAGRLGNEENGGEFQFGKGFTSDNGTVWDMTVMLEHWGEDVGLKKFVAGATNVFESQPNARVWAGRDFHSRPASSLNDYFWMHNDGQGAGIDNLEIAGAKLNLGAVGQVDGSSVSDSGNYAFTSKLHDMKMTDSLTAALFANYGFAAENTPTNGTSSTCTGTGLDMQCFVDDIDAYQLALQLDHTFGAATNKFITRYSDNADANIFNKTEGLSTLLVQIEGKVAISQQTAVEYLAGYQTLENENASLDDRTNTNLIVRPTYAWNDIHSTWLEAGYSTVDFDNQDGTNDAWKVTLSQNISFNMDSGARPMLRFYATVGDSNTEVELNRNAGEQDTFAVGAMWEASW